jgi:hypothetical protein
MFLVGESMTFAENELRKLLAMLEKMRERIMQTQSDYRSLVHQLYQMTQPFSKSRPQTEESFKEELRILAEMIGHCVVLDSSEILYTYAIYPIKKNPGILASSYNLQAYIEAFSNKYRSSESDSEKLYIRHFINEIKLINGEDVAAA